MIDISIKNPPPPVSPPQSGVDPVVSVPRSHRVEETDSEPEPRKRRKKSLKKKTPEKIDKEGEEQSSNDSPPHIDNYA